MCGDRAGLLRLCVPRLLLIVHRDVANDLRVNEGEMAQILPVLLLVFAFGLVAYYRDRWHNRMWAVLLLGGCTAAMIVFGLIDADTRWPSALFALLGAGFTYKRYRAVRASPSR